MEVSNITDWIPLKINRSDNNNDSLPTIMPEDIARIIEEGQQKIEDYGVIDDKDTEGEFIEDIIESNDDNNEDNIVEHNINKDDITEENLIKDNTIDDNTPNDDKIQTKKRKFFLFAFWDWFIGLFK